jgi:Fic family protein
MKLPKSPPEANTNVWMSFPADKLRAMLQAVRGPAVSGRYLHWDKLLYHSPPDQLSHQEWWAALKLQRRAQAKFIALADKKGRLFSFGLVDPLPQRLHQIDLQAGGLIQAPEEVTNPTIKERYIVRSLIEEAITSSQLEGAATTRQAAKEMIIQGRTPRNRSEQMIMNNYHTMQYISETKQQSLTKKMLLDIHRMITHDTLDDPSAAGRFRSRDEPRVVGDQYGQVFHEPPPADDLDKRFEVMRAFANGSDPSEFVHPVIRSMILHFWLAYDHPFVDGNGRAARALFYWSMLKHRYWLFEFISISEIILKAPAKYGRAFLYTETDDNDLTYFLIYHSEIIQRAIENLYDYIKKRSTDLRTLEAELKGLEDLNYRQRELISHALRHPGHRYTVASHAASHDITLQTSRTDLQALVKKKLLGARKVGKAFHYIPERDLETRLKCLDE